MNRYVNQNMTLFLFHTFQVRLQGPDQDQQCCGGVAPSTDHGGAPRQPPVLSASEAAAPGGPTSPSTGN